MLISIYADININCPMLYFAERYSYHNEMSKIYGYILKQKTVIQYDTCRPEWGICHSSEIPYVFGLPLRAQSRGYSTQDIDLSKNLINAIKEFVNDGKIDNSFNNRWTEAFGNFDVQAMELKSNQYQMSNLPFVKRCRNFWFPLLFV